jgi:UDP-N-acetylmuramoyl-L-alanyl-D-glutamate--2,6-diaminopimelate ligase
MDLGVLIEGVEVRAVHGPLSVRVCDVTEDSRTIVPGSLFVARRGEVSDGRRFAAQAVAAGAVAVLSDGEPIESTDGDGCMAGITWVVAADVPRAVAVVAERFFGEPSRELKLIGVTGTNGKTTVSWLIQRMLRAAGVPCGLVGTVVVDDGVEVASASLTTPPALEMSRTLGIMVEAGLEAAVMEVSSHALAQGRASALAFDAAVFTNLTGDHLDYHGTIESYAAAKAALFERLGADGVAIVNCDDPAHERMLRASDAKAMRCSMGGDGTCSARVIGMDVGGSRLLLYGPWGRMEVSVPFIGEHNAMNVLQAMAACYAVGVTEVSELAGLVGEISSPPGRLERVGDVADPFAVFVDYAHTDDALEKVLGAVRPIVTGRLVVVFGCGGDRDRTKRARMGAVADRLADVVVVTSDNPRTEEPVAIIDEIRVGIERGLDETLVVEPDRGAAIQRAVGLAGEGDVVVIAGKGHEDYQIVPDGMGGTMRHHFDDCEVALAALRERGLGAVRDGATAEAARL